MLPQDARTADSEPPRSPRVVDQFTVLDANLVERRDLALESLKIPEPLSTVRPP